MRFLAFIVLAGCYKPDLTEGLPCSEDGNCPEGQSCEMTTLTCNGTPVTGDAPATEDLVLALAFESAPSRQVPDLSGNNNNAGIVEGTVMFDPVQYGNGAIFVEAFNGSLEIAPAASLDVGGPGGGLTFSLWIQSEMPDSINYGVVFEKRLQDGEYLPPFVQYGFEVSSDIYAAIVSDETTLSRCEFPVLPGPHHFAFTYDDSIGFVGYLDGVVTPKKVGGCDEPIRTIFHRTSPSLIGKSGSGGERFAGQIDNLRIYRRVLTASEIVADMNTPIE